MNFREKWQETVSRKKSNLCLNIDAAEAEQRPEQNIGSEDKLTWAKRLIDETAHAIAAIKPNRQYYKDFSRAQMLELNSYAKDHGLLSIDDSKVADIGSTNDSAFYHAQKEGFDAITYAPFPGNIADACDQANKRNIGLIPLALMSNPEFLLIKNLMIEKLPAYEYFARTAKMHNAAGVVVGAPSASNHITETELKKIREHIGEEMTVLVPGIGNQGGRIEVVHKIFGRSAILSIGRDVVYARDPKAKIDGYLKLIDY